MKRIFLPVMGVLFLLLTAGCRHMSEHTDYDGHPFHHEEILVLDPPEDYVRHLPDLGLEVIHVADLDHVGDKLYHLRVVDGAHPHHVRTKHEEKFPDVIVDVHHHYQQHAPKVDTTYTARKAAKWQKAAAGCGQGIRIGVIDGHVNAAHEAFAGTPILQKAFTPKHRKVAQTAHGTGVASAIAGQAPFAGVLPGATVYAANVFYEGLKGKPRGSSFAIVMALDWLVQENVPIINMSIGGGLNKLVQKAVDHAVSKGIIVVASAGNSGPFTKKKNYPAALENVLAITAVDKHGTNARFASAGKYIDFATPGVDIWLASAQGGKAMSGTSFAAPIFTAYAAAVMQHRGLKTKEELKAFFKKHAKDTADIGHDKYTGWGVVQLPPVCKK